MSSTPLSDYLLPVVEADPIYAPNYAYLAMAYFAVRACCSELFFPAY